MKASTVVAFGVLGAVVIGGLWYLSNRREEELRAAEDPVTRTVRNVAAIGGAASSIAELFGVGGSSSSPRTYTPPAPVGDRKSWW